MIGFELVLNQSRFAVHLNHSTFKEKMMSSNYNIWKIRPDQWLTNKLIFVGIAIATVREIVRYECTHTKVQTKKPQANI